MMLFSAFQEIYSGCCTVAARIALSKSRLYASTTVVALSFKCSSLFRWVLLCLPLLIIKASAEALLRTCTNLGFELRRVRKTQRLLRRSGRVAAEALVLGYANTGKIGVLAGYRELRVIPSR